MFLLVGDRASLFAIDMARGDPPRVRALPPGLHVLENRPIRAPSPKVRHVRELLGDVWRLPATELEPRLESLLRDHEVPPAPDEAGGGLVRPAEVGAACVHTERYGTR